MKYTYVYKQSDGTRLEASMNAKSRDEVFSSLRAKGIKAIKVVAADGSRANGEIRGVRKRIVATLLILTAVIVGCSVYLVLQQPKTATNAKNPGVAKTTPIRPLPRQEILGDRSRIGATSEILNCKADLFLAKFAEPGRPFSLAAGEQPTAADFESALSTQLAASSNELTERIDLKRIVLGMRREYQRYINGGGVASNYVEAVISRQNREIEMRQHAVEHLTKMISDSSTANTRSAQKHLQSAYNFWIKTNAQLASLGIYAIPAPDCLRDYQQPFDLEE